MHSDFIDAMISSCDEILEAGKFQNFRAQCHSRGVLRRLGTPISEWPDYTESLDGDLVYAAQFLLYVGMHLKESRPGDEKGDECLTLGAEILEHLYMNSEDENDPERKTQLFSAALAYYMAGHFARAYVLVRDLEASDGLPRFIQPLRHLLLKDFGGLRTLVVRSLLDDSHSDEVLAGAISSGQMREEEAFCHVFESTLFHALSYFIKHIKSGESNLLESAQGIISDAIELAIDQRFVVWWWYLSCVKAMISTYREHSLWTNLHSLLISDTKELLTDGYIKANYRLATPIIELWPSQKTAIPYLFDTEKKRNLCLRMPTSSGKTKIAELAILRFLTDYEEDPDAKCVYVAPFRALAVEVEDTLRKVFLPLG